MNNTFTHLYEIGMAIGIVSIIGGLIYIGRKLQILDDLQELSKNMKHNIQVISNFLTRNNKGFNSSELKSMSPLTLTEEGNKFISELTFDDVFAENKQEFFGYIDSEKPKFKYDVENAAIKSIYALSDNDFMDFLKIFLYNNPNRTMDDTAPTLGVYIRDKYLEAHPEITQ